MLSFRWNYPHLEVLLDDHWAGIVSPNGWQGHTASVNHSIGEPVMSNTYLWHEMSLNEMQLIATEWTKHMTPQRCMQCAISAVAESKQLSFDDALKFLREKGYRLYYDPKTAVPEVQPLYSD